MLKQKFIIKNPPKIRQEPLTRYLSKKKKYLNFLAVNFFFIIFKTRSHYFYLLKVKKRITTFLFK